MLSHFFGIYTLLLNTLKDISSLPYIGKSKDFSQVEDVDRNVD